MSVTFAKGFEAAGVVAGISSQTGKQDVALVVNNGPLNAAAGVFTSNRFCAAPVQWSRKQVSDGELKAVILNSGGANACTGEEGYQQTVRTAEAVALMMHVEPSEIAVCSTGLIGELLPLDKVIEGAQKAFDSLDSSAQAGSDAAHAIMTTDTKPKTVNRLGSNEFRIGGMVKGSGMIAPQLATMLCVITTDAVVSAGQLQAALTAAVDRSFNRIDVDGCMSTNDTVLLLASGASGILRTPTNSTAWWPIVAPVSRGRSSVTERAPAMTFESGSPVRPVRMPHWRAGERLPHRTCSSAPSAAMTRTGVVWSVPSAPFPPMWPRTIRTRSQSPSMA